MAKIEGNLTTVAQRGLPATASAQSQSGGGTNWGFYLGTGAVTVGGIGAMVTGGLVIAHAGSTPNAAARVASQAVHDAHASASSRFVAGIGVFAVGVAAFLIGLGAMSDGPPPAMPHGELFGNPGGYDPGGPVNVKGGD
jgi:hypothetical protein